MISDIAKGIMTKFNETPESDDLRAVLTGGLYFVQAPQDVSFPYGVFNWNGSNIDEICGGAEQRIETASISVYLYTNDPTDSDEIFAVAEEFMQIYDWCVLSFGTSEYVPMKCQRISIVNLGITDNIRTVEINYNIIFSHS